MVDNTTREILYRITTGNDIPGLATSLKEDAGLMKRVEENKSNIKQLKEDEMRKFIKMEKGMTKITQQIHKDHKDITNMTEVTCILPVPLDLNLGLTACCINSIGYKFGFISN